MATRQHVVYIVDDEPDVLDLLRYNLQKAGFSVLEAGDGLQALRGICQHRPDAVVLDLMLPGKDGMQVCKELKSNPHTAAIPVLMLTAKGTDKERIGGLETGADDYVVKPFSPKEVVLRVQSLIRRSTGGSDRGMLIEVGNMRLDKGAFELKVDGKKVDLTTTEFKLICLLIERRGKSLSRDTLLQDVWGYRNLIDTRTVDTHIRRLREKLGDCANMLETVRGEGYRFRTDKFDV